MTTTNKTKKPKKEWSKKEPEVFRYFNAKGEKLWGYRHRYYDTLGKRTEKSEQGLASENIAIRKLLEVKSALINGNAKQVDNSNLTVSEWMDIWFETHQNDWEITTQVQREQAIRLNIKPLLGKQKLIELDRSTYKRKFINVLLKTYEPSTVYIIHATFKIAINAAVEDEILPRNRFSKIKIELDSENDNFLNPAELKRFLTTAKEHEGITNYSIILTLSYTGMRRGEALGLKWNNIDFDKKTITIERTRDEYGARKPKTKKSNRIIFVSDILLNQLKAYRIWCKKIMLTFGKRWVESDFIFITDRGATPVSVKSVCEPVERVIKKSGIKRITPHGLRHTHATIMISKGVPLQTVADRLGNTPEMILRVYGHTLKELEIESVKVFNDALNF
ncbi:tyrosine-type recombinase/integrase [Sporosarcina soli]|uniref:Tyrosine-type recombinase/integrase n=1 Tax=Sporosarcina soli TaxID=334736 RepID=A0ABW0TEJ5_9BACL